MLYREIIAVYSQIHIKHINTLCGQNVYLLNVKLAVHIVTNSHYGGTCDTSCASAQCLNSDKHKTNSAMAGTYKQHVCYQSLSLSLSFSFMKN
jgi:hypothetical protein